MLLCVLCAIKAEPAYCNLLVLSSQVRYLRRGFTSYIPPWPKQNSNPGFWIPSMSPYPPDYYSQTWSRTVLRHLLPQLKKIQWHAPKQEVGSISASERQTLPKSTMGCILPLLPVLKPLWNMAYLPTLEANSISETFQKQGIRNKVHTVNKVDTAHKACL